MPQFTQKVKKFATPPPKKWRWSSKTINTNALFSNFHVLKNFQLALSARRVQRYGIWDVATDKTEKKKEF